MPNGAVAPGKVCPSPPVPMNGSTLSTAVFSGDAAGGGTGGDQQNSGDEKGGAGGKPDHSPLLRHHFSFVIPDVLPWAPS